MTLRFTEQSDVRYLYRITVKSKDNKSTIYSTFYKTTAIKDIDAESQIILESSSIIPWYITDATKQHQLLGLGTVVLIRVNKHCDFDSLLDLVSSDNSISINLLKSSGWIASSVITFVY